MLLGNHAELNNNKIVNRHGFTLDFSWDVNGVVGFTAAETFEADILFGTGPVIGSRYGDFSGPAGAVTSDNVDGINV